MFQSDCISSQPASQCLVKPFVDNFFRTSRLGRCLESPSPSLPADIHDPDLRKPLVNTTPERERSSHAKRKTGKHLEVHNLTTHAPAVPVLDGYAATHLFLWVPPHLSCSLLAVAKGSCMVPARIMHVLHWARLMIFARLSFKPRELRR